jgi:hypothetical protein
VSVTCTIQKTVSGGGSSTLGGSHSETGTNLAAIDSSFPAASVNTVQAAAFSVAALKLIELIADQPMTLTTNGTNEVQRITITGTPTGGTFTITWNGQTTTAIAFNATNATVLAALEALSNIAVGDVSVTGGPFPGSTMDVTFLANLGNTNVAAMTTTDSFTGGSSPASAVSTITAGVAPSNSFALQAGMPLEWEVSPGYFANPFSVDVTKFNVTCATSARLQGRILT